MSRWTSFGLLLVGLVLAELASVQAYECTGMGRKYCTQESPAHRSRSECPKPCQRSECEGRRSTELERRGAQRDSSEGGTPTWEEIANSGDKSPIGDAHQFCNSRHDVTAMPICSIVVRVHLTICPLVNRAIRPCLRRR